MAKTKRGFILTTSFLSAAASIISCISLGTQGWVKAKATLLDKVDSRYNDYIEFGLFRGVFHQESLYTANFDLSMVCRFDLNICALLCGKNAELNLKKLYKNQEDSQIGLDINSCPKVMTSDSTYISIRIRPGADVNGKARVFINAGVWICTVIFLIISIVMGSFASILGVWNTASNIDHGYFGVTGLYINNSIAFFAILLSIALWASMYAIDLVNDIPCYKTFLEDFSTENNAHLGYSFWLLLVSLCLYLSSLCLLYIRNLISKETEKSASQTINTELRPLRKID